VRGDKFIFIFRKILNINFKAPKIEIILLFSLTALLIFAYLFNLGIIPLHADEGIRASVAFEMLDSENYIVPTLSSEYYYKKPPFYNWIIAGTFSLFGSFSEFVFRLPSVIPLFLFALSIWLCSRIYLGNRTGILAGVLFMIGGSMITRDSMLGHIDIFFSWITFLSFFSIFYFYVKKKFIALFLISYILAAIGVLCKGLPSFLFQGLTLLAWFIYKKEFKRLLSIQHFIGIAVFAGIVCAYFYSYSKYNSLAPYFEALIDQSSQRTPIDNPWYESVIHVFSFPFENVLIHLMPSSLIFLFVLKKGSLKRWFKNDFLAFLILTFAINIIPYWLSPGYYPRYLYMLYPILFILGAFAYYQNRKSLPKLNSFFEYFFLCCGILLTFTYLIPLFLQELSFIPFLYFKVLALCILSITAILFFFKFKNQRIYLVLIFIALFRIGFDFFVLPYRAYVDPNEASKQKEYSAEILKIIGENDVHLYKNKFIKEAFYYYLGTGKGSALDHVHFNVVNDDFYIADKITAEKLPCKIYYSFKQDWHGNPDLVLIKFEKEP